MLGLRRAARSLKNRFAARALILLYHRVVDARPDPQLLCVSPRHFAEHLEILRRWGYPLALKAIDSLQENRGRCGMVVTFDDGYADNLLQAKPLLERYSFPATVFVATGLMGSKGGFWKDALKQMLLTPGTLPQNLDIDICGHPLSCGLDDAARYSQEDSARYGAWNVADKSDPTSRHRLYRELCARLSPLSDPERRDVLRRLRSWAAMKITHALSDRTLRDDEWVELAKGGLVEIGAHTVTHPVLSALPAAEQRQEIEKSKAHLETVLGVNVTSFAYPYGGSGHYSAASVALVRDAGFNLACANFAGVVRSGTDRFQLPRFLVRDWPGEKFASHLSEWLRY